jgi:tetratricopeptide (TPR) repeat protein
MLLAVVMGLSSVTGCSSEKKKTYEQAEKDLEQGSYEYALQGYAASVENGVNLPESYRGAGIANMRMGNYEDAIVNFTSALNCEKVSKSLRRDLLLYRASAEFKAEQYDSAMLDCQTLSQEFSMDAESYFLTGRVALAMDSYSEAASNFSSAYEKDSTYDRAIQIYEAYLEKDMEADGTRYLENALTTEPKSAQDYCDRGLVYYYMQDYDNARLELIEASKKDSTEALLILGMVYLAQNNISNARAMYQQYISAEGDSAKGYNGLALCDIKEGNYDSALSNISTGISMADTEEMQSLLYNEIVAYEKKSDFATALTKAREYMDMYPDDESVAKEVSFLKTRTDSQ